jgi:hypothetical protein
MYNELLGIPIGLILIVCTYAGFRQGLRLGMTVAKGTIPDAIKNPITIMKEHKLTKEQEKKRAKEEAEFMAMLAYTGESILREVDNE